MGTAMATAIAGAGHAVAAWNAGFVGSLVRDLG